MRLRRFLAFLSIVALASCGGCPGCPQVPRPTVVIGPPATASNAARVTATITPNEFAVTKVILEFGRRPGANNAVNILYSSEPASYNLSHTFDPPTLPATAPFTATFRFPALTTGELIDYQFKVTHRNADGNELFFWSDRQTFQVTQGAAAPPGGPVGGGGGNNGNCPIVNVSRPANSISGGAVEDLGGHAPAVSADGQFVAFTTKMKLDPNAADGDQVYRRNVQTAEIVPVSRPATSTSGGSTTDRGGTSPSISADGQRVAFVSRTKFDANAADVDQIYVRDLANGSAQTVTTPTGGAQDRGGTAPMISGNGRFVVFVSQTKFDPQAPDDVDQIYRRDLQTGDIASVTRPARSISGGVVTDRGGHSPSISDDGRFVAFVSETKFDPNVADEEQVYVRDLDTGTVLRVSTPANGIGGGATTDLGGNAPRISGDGQFVAFVSRTKFDPNASGSEQIYRRALQSGAIQVVTRPATSTSGGAVTDLGGRGPSISANGQRVSFVTQTKFDADATDGDQIYVRDLGSGEILRVSTPANGINGGATTDRGGASPVITGDGRFVVFVTRTQFDPNAANDVDEIYRRCLP